jgi:ubiquinone/menaquinone biosynthesis C-methylase UbiE
METKRRVPADTYDEAYLLSDNTEGFQEFSEGSLSFVKQFQLSQLELSPGTSLLEVGFGRGEFLCHCARLGAAVSGIDYSPAALEIARRTLAEFPDAHLRVADCKELPFESDSFDRVYSGDVLEHQDIEDGAQMLREMHRVLRPGGFMFVHTSPNTIFTRLILPVAKPLLRRIDEQTVRVLEEHMKVNSTVHVNEYNLFSLRKVARMAGLDRAEIWIGKDILRSSRHRHTKALSSNRLVRLIGRLGAIGPVRFLFGNDLYLRSRK